MRETARVVLEISRTIMVKNQHPSNHHLDCAVKDGEVGTSRLTGLVCQAILRVSEYSHRVVPDV